MIEAGMAMIDTSTKWPDVLYVALISVKAQQARAQCSAIANGMLAVETTAQLSIAEMQCDAFNVAMQLCCSSFPMHYQEIKARWEAEPATSSPVGV